MFFFVGNDLSIDLVNTEIVDNGEPVDLLGGFDEVLDWAFAAGLIAKSEAEKLRSRWKGSRQARELYREAVELRKVVRSIVVAVAAGRAVTGPQLARLNGLLERRAGHFEVRREGNGFKKVFRPGCGDDLSSLLWPVAEAAADLLGVGDLSLIRKCENPACVLYFYDTSKRHGRRWCSMSGCGNRAKASAFYNRRKVEGP
jgi:predicted RNA-binding Zn ribbon-like protein